MVDFRLILELLAVLLGGGGIIGGVVALFKVRPEAAKVSVDAAQGAVIVQTGVITALQAEIKRLAAAEAECEERYELLRNSFKAIDERKNPSI